MVWKLSCVSLLAEGSAMQLPPGPGLKGTASSAFPFAVGATLRQCQCCRKAKLLFNRDATYR